MAETVKDKAKKVFNSLFTGGSKAVAAKPEPKDLGKGYAASAASAAKSRNEKTKEVAKEMDSYKKGGKVKKTGPAFLHKNERVLTTKQTQKMEKKPAVKKAIGLKPKKR